jgi:FkbM family methyltransferase
LHTPCKINSVELIQYTPNLFLELCAANINNIEPDTISWIDSFKPNAVFYDIGASNGVYAMYADKARNASCVAIEADAQNFAILQNNCYLNKISPEKFTAINIALGSEPSVLKIHSEEFAAGMHSKTVDSAGRQFNQKNAAFSFNTLVERLDFLIEQYKLSYPDYIKIDVDGAEFDVLAGSEKLLREIKAEILIEIPDSSIKKLDSYLEKFGFTRTNSYKIFEIIGSEVEGIRNHLYKKHGA